MAHKSLPKATLVIVELGASWPGSLVATETGSCRVLAEAEGEGPLAFAARVEIFVQNAFPRGTQVSLALVACNQRADEMAEAARRAVAGCLLARASAGGIVSFTAADEASDRFRRRLFDLVAELGGSNGAEGRVRAVFGEDVGHRASGPAASVQGVVARVA